MGYQKDYIFQNLATFKEMYEQIKTIPIHHEINRYVDPCLSINSFRRIQF